MFRRVLRLSLCAAFFLAASAQAAPTGSPPDSARVAAAERLLDAMHFDSQIERTMDAVIGEVEKQIETSLSATLAEPAPELIAKIKEISGDHMRKILQRERANIRRGTALIYARHFTTSELDRLAVLQTDPVIAKLQSQMPQIAAESMVLSRAMIESGEAELQARMKAAVEEYVASKSGKPVT